MDYRLPHITMKEIVYGIACGIPDIVIATVNNVSTKTVGRIRKDVYSLVTRFHDKEAEKVIDYPEEILFVAKLKRKKRRKDSKNQVPKIIFPKDCHIIFMNGDKIYAVKNDFADFNYMREVWLDEGFKSYFMKYYDYSFTREKPAEMKEKYKGFSQDLGFCRMYAAIYKSNGNEIKQFSDSKLFHFVKNHVKDYIAQFRGLNDEQLESCLKDCAVRHNYPDTYQEIIFKIVESAEYNTALKKGKHAKETSWT